MDRIAKIKIGCILFVVVAALGAILFLGIVEYSRQKLLTENLEKGKAMLMESDYQSARIYLSMFERKGNVESGFNLYKYASAVIAYQIYLGTGDINQIQLASDYLGEIDMSKLDGYTGRVQELKSKVAEGLESYRQLVDAQEQASVAAVVAKETKNYPLKKSIVTREKEEKTKNTDSAPNAAQRSSSAMDSAPERDSKNVVPPKRQ